MKLCDSYHLNKAQNLISSHTGNQVPENVINAYYQDRHYHEINHILNLLQRSEERKDTNLDWRLALAIIYHDVVYDATRKDNEDLSADMFLKDWTGKIPVGDLVEIDRAIRETKTHEPTTELSRQLCELDMEPVYLGNYDLLVSNNELIRKEFHMYSDRQYYEGVMKFFKPYSDLSPDHERYYQYLAKRLEEASQ